MVLVRLLSVGDDHPNKTNDEAVVIYTAGGQNPGLPASSMPKWGPRPLKFPPMPEEEVLDILRPHGDIHAKLQAAAWAVTTARPSARYQESNDLKKLRRLAQREPPKPTCLEEGRDHAQGGGKRELVRQAGGRSWASYRELKTQRRPNKAGKRESLTTQSGRHNCGSTFGAYSRRSTPPRSGSEPRSCVISSLSSARPPRGTHFEKMSSGPSWRNGKTTKARGQTGSPSKLSATFPW